MCLNEKGKHNFNKIVIHAVWCAGHAGGRCHPERCDRLERGPCEPHEVHQVHVQSPAPESVF